jgi:HSP20 family molecular chaperone IbpA
MHWPFGSSHSRHETFYPDVDLRDYDTGYAIDVELPGCADTRKLKVEWTSERDIFVSGSIERPSVPWTDPHRPLEANGAKSQNGVNGESKKTSEWTPTVLVGERKTGNFHRRFRVPSEVDVKNMKVRLESGLLTIRVEKVKHHHKTTGEAQIELAGQ